MWGFLHYITERNMPCALQTGAFGLTRMMTVWNNLTDRQTDRQTDSSRTISIYMQTYKGRILPSDKLRTEYVLFCVA